MEAVVKENCFRPQAFWCSFLDKGQATQISTPQNLQELESEMILAALQRNDFDRTKTADELGIHKTTLWRKIKKFKIELS